MGGIWDGGHVARDEACLCLPPKLCRGATYVGCWPEIAAPQTMALLLPIAAAIIVVVSASPAAPTNSRPVIGVLTQPTDCDGSFNLSTWGNSYLVASYVKWVESAGARVVPVPWNATADELKVFFQQTNGLLFPGGGTSVSAKSNTTYRQTGVTLFELAKAANQAGDVYPLWGTCLGFEELMDLSVSPLEVLKRTTGTDPLLAPLALSADAASSRLLGGTAGEACRATLSSQNATINLHHMGAVSPPSPW